jgi:hypothetical protein
MQMSPYSHPQPRPVVIQPDDESIRLVPLTQGQVAIIDADVYDWASGWHWYARYDSGTKSFYATRNGRSGEPRTILLHRQILGEPGQRVDHWNGNSLDCRRANLRPCTSSQNQANSRLRSDNRSGVPGVWWDKDKNKWEAYIKIAGRLKRLGYFANKEDAIAARLAAERLYFGEFAFSARRKAPQGAAPPSLALKRA